MAKKNEKSKGDAIQTTLGALVVAAPALERLGQKTLPIKVAYHIAKLRRLVAAEAELYYEQRIALIKELGAERDPTPAEKAAGQTHMFEVKREHVDDFQKRMDTLAGQDVAIPWAPIHIDALGAIDIAANELVLLEPLLADEPSSAAKV